MTSIRTCFCLLIIFTLILINEGGRYGGGRGSSSRGGTGSSSSGRSRIPSTSGSSGSSTRVVTFRPAHRPATPPPTPRSSSRPAYRPPTSRPTPRSSSRPAYRPPTSPPIIKSTPRPSYVPPTGKSTQKVNAKPVNSATQNTHQSVHTRTHNNPITSGRPGPTPPPRGSGFTDKKSYTVTTRPSYSPGSVSGANRPPGWSLPPRAATVYNHPQGPPRTGYSTGSSPHSNYNPYFHGYTPYDGPSKVKIVNKYNYHHPGYYVLPVPSSYPGYYHYPSYYHYSSHDTGSTALGFFLGYGLGRLTTPTYSHHSFYNGYTPRYDHYTVHHYYHNRESVPPKQEIPATNIVGCVGDSSTVCPANTVSLCTAEGTLMCVATVTATTPCVQDNRQVSCVKSTIPCVNSTAPECQNVKQGNVTIDIPCVSTAEVNGNIKYVDNTIIVDVPANQTVNTTSGTNSTLTVNGTLTINETSTLEYSTKYPITTTPTPEKAVNENVQKVNEKQNFCVTVLAVPALKIETEGEKLYDDAKDIATKFLESVWGL